MHVASDADYRKPGGIGTIDAQAFAKCVGIRPKALRHRFTYDGDRLASFVVKIRESTPAEQWNSHGAEEIGADQTMVNDEVGGPCAILRAFDKNRRAPGASA